MAEEGGGEYALRQLTGMGVHTLHDALGRMSDALAERLQSH